MVEVGRGGGGGGGGGVVVVLLDCLQGEARRNAPWGYSDVLKILACFPCTFRNSGRPENPAFLCLHDVGGTRR